MSERGRELREKVEFLSLKNFLIELVNDWKEICEYYSILVIRLENESFDPCSTDIFFA